MSDAGGVPGGVLESFTIGANSLEVFGNNNAPIVLTSLLNPVLSAGILYWLTVIGPAQDNIAWNLNNTSDTSLTVTSINGGATWLPLGLTPGAFQVDGVQAPSLNRALLRSSRVAS
jgi:hypothetical protein